MCWVLVFDLAWWFCCFGVVFVVDWFWVFLLVVGCMLVCWITGFLGWVEWVLGLRFVWFGFVG